MSKKFWWAISIFVVIIVSLGIFGFTKSFKPVVSQKTIKIAHFRETSALPFYIANEKGYFKAENLNVELVEVDSKQLIDTLVTGKVDFTSAIAWPSVVGFEIEHPEILKPFGIMGESNSGDTIDGFLVKEDSKINKLEDFKGKTIAFDNPRGIPSAKMVFKKIGFDPDKDVVLMDMGKDIIASALLSGKVDAVWTTQPSLTIIANKIKTKIVEPNMRTRYLTDPYWISPMGLTTNNFILQNREIVNKVENALKESLAFIQNNPVETRIIATKYTPLTSDITEKMGVQTYKSTPDNQDYLSMQSIVDSLVEAQILKKGTGLIPMYAK
ncbi:MAG: ABC transporter substrate-binding protein [Candidatus Magasanikbacteria bacterium]